MLCFEKDLNIDVLIIDSCQVNVMCSHERFVLFNANIFPALLSAFPLSPKEEVKSQVGLMK